MKSAQGKKSQIEIQQWGDIKAVSWANTLTAFLNSPMIAEHSRSSWLAMRWKTRSTTGPDKPKLVKVATEVQSRRLEIALATNLYLLLEMSLEPQGESARPAQPSKAKAGWFTALDVLKDRTWARRTGPSFAGRQAEIREVADTAPSGNSIKPPSIAFSRRWRGLQIQDRHQQHLPTSSLAMEVVPIMA